MNEPDKTREELQQEIKKLRKRVQELEAFIAPASLNIPEVKSNCNGSNQSFPSTKNFSATKGWNRMFRTLLEQSSVSIVVTDREGRIEYVNPYFVELTGFNEREAIGRKPDILKSGHHPLHFYEELWSTILAGKTWRGELYNRKKNGEFYWESAIIFPIKDSSGKIERFIGLKENISARKQTEEALKENEALLKTVIGSMLVGLLAVDAETHQIVDANPYALKMIGISRDELIGEVCQQGICPVKQGECPVTDCHQEIDHAESTILNAKGESIPVLKSVVCVQRRGRKYLLETFADLSALKRAEESQRASHRFLHIAHQRDNLPQLVEEYLKAVKDVSLCSAVAIEIRGEDGQTIYRSSEGIESPVEELTQWLRLHSTHLKPSGSADESMRFQAGENIREGPLFDNQASRSAATLRTAVGRAPPIANLGIPYESIAVIPVGHPGGLLGFIYLADGRKDMFSKELMRLLEDAAKQMGTAVLKILATRRLRQAQQELEQRVQERTQELLAANKLLEAEIAEHRKTEEELRKQSAFREGIVAHAFEGLNVWHTIDEFPYMRVIVWNRQMEEITGYSMDEINRLGWAKAMYDDPALQARAEATLREVAAGAVHTRLEREIRRADGQKRTILISSSLMPSHGNQRHVIALMVDVTEFRKAERAIRNSEAQFRGLVENIRVGILIIKDGVVVYQNPEQKRIFENLPGATSVEDLAALIHPEDRAVFRQIVEAANCQDQSLAEVILRLKKHSEEADSSGFRWISCRTSALGYQGERACLVTMSDITQLKQLERMVMLREKMASLGYVATGIAHEIRNPLSGINVYLEAILESFQDPECSEDVSGLIRETQKASCRIENVVRRVLDFSRPTDLKLRPGCMNEAIYEASKLVIASLRKSSINLQLDLAPDLPQVFVDQQLMEQAVLNLITNAADALKVEREERDIRISTSAGHKSVLIRVEDNGPGVAHELRNKIFEPFFTTRGRGMGIGLGICQRIITDHGGTIDVTSSPMGGAQFNIVVPIEKRRVSR